jgi:predicted anti-sigma-YlaC factor YlaD
MFSARLDGEELPGEAEVLDTHLAGCAGCGAWAERAARITRLTRLRLAEPETEPETEPEDTVATVIAPHREAVLDLVAAVVAQAPPRRRVGPGALRLALGAVGIGQCALAVSGIVGVGGDHGAVELAGASAAHMAHETAAWNLALGVGFLWVAMGTARRMSGLVALVGAFVGVLAVLSVLDVLDGQVDPVRLATHLLVVAGFVLLLVLRRVERTGDGGADAVGPPGFRAGRPVAPERAVDDTSLRTSAHHRAA